MLLKTRELLLADWRSMRAQISGVEETEREIQKLKDGPKMDRTVQAGEMRLKVWRGANGWKG